MPNGDMVVTIPNRKIRIPAQNELGETVFNGVRMKMQKAFDEVYMYLKENHAETEYIWNINLIKKWGKYPASEKQKNQIKRIMKNFDVTDLNKMQASQILNRLFCR